MANETLLTTSDCFGFVDASDPATIAFYKQNRRELTEIYRTYHGWMQLPFATVGIFLASIYSIACFRAISDRRVSRKSYVLLLNRSFGDVFTCVVTFGVFGYVQFSEEPNRDIVQITDSILIGCFWAGMSSYVCLSLLKLYAVARPLAYRHNMTMVKCIYLIILSWIVFLFMTCYAFSVMALSKIRSLMDWSGCRFETCLRSYYRLRNYSLVTVYWITMIVFGLTVVLIKRHQRFARLHSTKVGPATNGGHKNSKKLQDRFPLWKLAINVGTFAIFNACYMIWGVSSLFLTSDKCFFVTHFNKMIRLLAFVHLSIMIRIIVDPMLAFFTDLPIRRQMLCLLGLQKYMKTYSRNQMEENSSETPPATSSTTLTSRPNSVRPRLE